MKILLVSTFGEPAFGVSSYANPLLKALRDRLGVDQSVSILDFEQPYPKFLYPAKIPERYRENGLHWAKPCTWKVQDNVYDVVHIQYWTPAIAPCLERFVKNIKRANSKVVITAHNTKPHEMVKFLSYSEKKLLERADAIITHTYDEAFSKTYAGKYHVIPHGIELSNPVPASVQDYELCGLNKNRRYILFFGNVRPYKGVEDLLHVWSRLSTRYTDFDLVVAGRVWFGSTKLKRMAGIFLNLKSFEEKYREACKEVSDSRVHFVEKYLEEEYIEAACRIADFVVFPYTHFDAQSGAAARAAGLGKTLLVSDVGGLPSLTSNASNVFHAGDELDFIKHMEKLLSRSIENVKRDEELQKSHLKTFSWSNVADKHVALYSALCMG